MRLWHYSLRTEQAYIGWIWQKVRKWRLCGRPP